MKVKPKYWYRQSSVIPYRKLKGEIKILIISSRKGKKWIFPKGIIEPGLTSQDSALKEAEEEAGIKGIIENISIGSYSYKKWGGKCRVEVFNMKVEEILDSWEEDFRERKWINIDQAKEFINSKKIIQIVSLFNEKINSPNTY